MKWLTLEYIKAHSRIDFDIDDDLLEIYGNSAGGIGAEYLQPQL